MKKILQIEDFCQGFLLYLRNSQKLGLLPEIVDNLANVHRGSPKEVRFAALGLVNFLQKSGNLRYLPQIIKRLQAGIPQRAEVITAYPLTKKQEKEILNLLSARFKKKLAPVFKVQGEILGGIIIKVADFFLDASISGQIKQLEEKLGE